MGHHSTLTSFFRRPLQPFPVYVSLISIGEQMTGPGQPNVSLAPDEDVVRRALRVHPAALQLCDRAGRLSTVSRSGKPVQPRKYRPAAAYAAPAPEPGQP